MDEQWRVVRYGPLPQLSNARLQSTLSGLGALWAGRNNQKKENHMTDKEKKQERQKAYELCSKFLLVVASKGAEGGLVVAEMKSEIKAVSKDADTDLANFLKIRNDMIEHDIIVEKGGKLNLSTKGCIVATSLLFERGLITKDEAQWLMQRLGSAAVQAGPWHSGR